MSPFFILILNLNMIYKIIVQTNLRSKLKKLGIIVKRYKGSLYYFLADSKSVNIKRINKGAGMPYTPGTNYTYEITLNSLNENFFTFTAFDVELIPSVKNDRE